MYSSWRRARRTSSASGGLVSIAVATLLAACEGEQYVQTTFRPVTDFGEALNAVFANTFAWTMGILAIVVLLVVFVMIRFRERPGEPLPKQIHGSTKLELMWTTIPAIIVIFIAIPTVRTIFATQQPPGEGALEVEVIGHQWWWEFRYPEQGVVTANELMLPVGREIHLRMYSADVVHSFWIPRLGGKRDVNPQPAVAEGQRPQANHLVFTVNEPGTYSGQCAEYCGASHAIMRVTAVAVPQPEFEDWVASMQDSPAQPPGTPPATAPGAARPNTPPADTAAGTAQPGDDGERGSETGGAGAPDSLAVAQDRPALVEEGERVFLSRSCIACHTISNTTARGVLGPNLTRFGSRPTIGAGALPNSAENLERWITNPRAVKPGTMMPGTETTAPPPGNPAGPPFPATGLTPEEVRAVAAYLFSLK